MEVISLKINSRYPKYAFSVVRHAVTSKSAMHHGKLSTSKNLYSEVVTTLPPCFARFHQLLACFVKLDTLSTTKGLNFIMVFICEAAECFSHSSKQNQVYKYPWMKGLRWVKWPIKNPGTVARWKRLIRREGKTKESNIVDMLKINRRSRLCSRHFDEHDIDMWGNATRDPHYFAWNNWGRPAKPRSRTALKKLDTARGYSNFTDISAQVVSEEMITSSVPTVPDVGQEIEISDEHSLNMQPQLKIGRMFFFFRSKLNKLNYIQI